jgi:hypothetical protein
MWYTLSDDTTPAATKHNKPAKSSATPLHPLLELPFTFFWQPPSSLRKTVSPQR